MFFEYYYSFFNEYHKKKTALFAQLYKINYICTVFYAVTYKVTDEEKLLRTKKYNLCLCIKT